MRIDRLSVNGFKNLTDFDIDLEDRDFTSVLIGENGTGKSNLIEAIVLLFRDLDLDRPAPFSYDMVYRCRGKRIHILASSGKRPSVHVGGASTEEAIPWAQFQREKDAYLPKYVFAYYSGPGSRLRSYFDPHQARFYRELLDNDTGEAPPIRRFFYCLPEHSRFVLLAYFLLGEEPPEFLCEYFGIDAFDSALLVLKRPHWAKNYSERRPPPYEVAQRGDRRFWYSRGVVRTFLQRLWDEALAPIAVIEPHQDDYRMRPTQEEHLYLYLPNQAALRRLSKQYPTEAAFFAALESAEISSLVRDVRVRVRRGGESIVFSELSEGEQQLLTVVGLLQFTKHEESLFLLDEPDTHLNPVWKTRYLEVLSRQADVGETSQLILATHDPLTIAGLESRQVQIFRRDQNRVSVRQPSESPRGMGVAGVLLRMFGLPSTLDLSTQRKLDRRNELSRLVGRKPEQDAEMEALTRELGDLGLVYEARDPRYQRFLEALRRWEVEQAQSIDELPREEQEELVDSILKDLLEVTT